MTMQRKAFEGVPIGLDRGERYEDRMRAIRAELLHAASLPTADDSPWYVLKVMTGRELAVEKVLREEKIECCVPMRKGREMRRRHRIIRAPMLPVMTGYVLVRCHRDSDAFVGLIGVEHVIGLLGGAENPHGVPDKEVKRFNGNASAGAYDWERRGVQFKVGQKVRISEGPFASFSGVIVSCRADGRGDAVVEADVFGRMTPVLCPLAILEAI